MSTKVRESSIPHNLRGNVNILVVRIVDFVDRLFDITAGWSDKGDIYVTELCMPEVLTQQEGGN
jgi:hypothetical protein